MKKYASNSIKHYFFLTLNARKECYDCLWSIIFHFLYVQLTLDLAPRECHILSYFIITSVFCPLAQPAVFSVFAQLGMHPTALGSETSKLNKPCAMQKENATRTCDYAKIHFRGMI
jgi:hypothetical protein